MQLTKRGRDQSRWDGNGRLWLALLAPSALVIGAYLAGAAIYSLQFRWRFAHDLASYTHPGGAPVIAGFGGVLMLVALLIVWVEAVHTENWMVASLSRATSHPDGRVRPIKPPRAIGSSILIVLLIWTFLGTMRPYIHLQDSKLEVVGYLGTRSYDLTQYSGANLAFQNDEPSMGYEVEFYDGWALAYRVKADARGMALMLVGFIEAWPVCPGRGYNSRIGERWRLALYQAIQDRYRQLGIRPVRSCYEFLKEPNRPAYTSAG